MFMNLRNQRELQKEGPRRPHSLTVRVLCAAERRSAQLLPLLFSLQNTHPGLLGSGRPCEEHRPQLGATAGRPALQQPRTPPDPARTPRLSAPLHFAF